MEKIANRIAEFLAHMIYSVDTFLYKRFGYCSKMRAKTLERRAKNIQRKLDMEHGTDIYSLYWDD